MDIPALSSLPPFAGEVSRAQLATKEAAVSPSAVDPTAPPRAGEQTDDIRRIAEEFEGMFLAEMLAPMFESLDTDGLGGGGVGERVFRPMLVERYAEAIAKSGGIGLADAVVRELVRLQGNANGSDR